MRRGDWSSGRHCPDETFAEEHGKLCLRHVPFARRHFPLFLRSVQDQIQQLGRRLVVGKVAPRPYCAAELGIQSFNGICRIDDPPDFIGEGEEWNDLGPCPAPALAVGRITLPPEAGLEGRQCLLGGRSIDGTVRWPSVPFRVSYGLSTPRNPSKGRDHALLRTILNAPA